MRDAAEASAAGAPEIVYGQQLTADWLMRLRTGCRWLSGWQDHLVRALEAALQSAQLPAEVVSALLALAQAQELQGENLPIDIRLLAQLAER
jgi:hypothetical protein